jgi:hypothetical protein
LASFEGEETTCKRNAGRQEQEAGSRLQTEKRQRCFRWRFFGLKSFLLAAPAACCYYLLLPNLRI